MCHGDVRPENVALTSWDWAFLVDWAPHKPVLLPADNPADFSLYFDTSGRRRCYLAPERLVDPAAGGLAPAAAAAAQLTPAMVRARGAEAFSAAAVGEALCARAAAAAQAGKPSAPPSAR